MICSSVIHCIELRAITDEGEFGKFTVRERDLAIADRRVHKGLARSRSLSVPNHQVGADAASSVVLC